MGKKTFVRLLAIALAGSLSFPLSSAAADTSLESEDSVEIVAQIPEQKPVQANVETATSSDGEEPNEDVIQVTVTADLVIAGVTWKKTEESPKVEYRTQSADSSWGDWELADVETGADEEPRSGTEPLVLSGVKSLQVKASYQDGETPKELKVSVIDPGVGVGDEAASPRASYQSRSVENAGGVTIHSRSDWGADERIRDWEPQPINPKGVAIHHTAGTNNYSPGQVPAILRGIYYFHAVTRGWGDIGYNVLVDKFGRAWQGRAGTFRSPNQGAHVRSANDVTFGISVMGDYSRQAPSEAAQLTVAKLAAAQLKLRGVNPLGTFRHRGHTFNTISGHRDFSPIDSANRTSCPGQAFYDRLGWIRQRAADLASGWASGSASRVNRSFNGENLVFDDAGNAVGALASSGRKITFGERAELGKIVDSGSRVYAPADWDGDGLPDLISISSDGLMWLRSRTSKGFAEKRQIGNGWNGISAVVTGLDWDGDGLMDIIGRWRDSGDLTLYSGNGSGNFKASRQIGNGWNIFTRLEGVANFMGGRPVILGQDRSGRLFTYAGNGRGGFSEIFQSGQGWDSVHKLVGAKDWTCDGANDLLAVMNDGALRVYSGNGRGGFGPVQSIGSGWHTFEQVLDAKSSDTTKTELYGISESGSSIVYPASFYTDPVTKMGHLASTMVIPAGNWDGDSKPDVITRTSDGDLMLHSGGGNNKIQIGNGWSEFDQIVAAPSWNADDLPYLLTYKRDTGEVLFYKADSNGRFISSDVVGYFKNMKQMVYIADFVGTSEPTIAFITFDGDFMVVNRKSRLLKEIGNGWQNFKSVVGGSDFNNDGRPDIVAQGDDSLRIYYGAASGGFGEAEPGTSGLSKIGRIR
ncbi:FG-GAP-like repeat-containing protein [Propionimicrobium lymphophilum]|uniref:FG-GAP-like repeat-containing protein n=1 Tax=Propionimicrobium lymphophilum TaxID=33012 RepID=UPI00288A5972|nr:FG-GAP-like repeat-containing protein [Propionimicrobium lymphophilum]